MLRYLPLILMAAFTIYAFVDCARTEQDAMRSMPKWAWLLLIFFIGIIGAVAYWFFGRPKNPGLGRPGPRKIIPPDDNPDFLRSI
ncbi:unannotated protein [freshwater metagenome]|uniref:Unannotated protein n=1 Tax=freshwater metagenome TaxID=449393 RepID=A0A6J7XT28_9ZZZZ|nr:hypothetical protein [Actinomycetota bacterium]